MSCVLQFFRGVTWVILAKAGQINLLLFLCTAIAAFSFSNERRQIFRSVMSLVRLAEKEMNRLTPYPGHLSFAPYSPCSTELLLQSNRISLQTSEPTLA